MPTDEQIREILQQEDALFHERPGAGRYDHDLTTAEAYKLAVLINLTQAVDNNTVAIQMSDWTPGD